MFADKNRKSDAEQSPNDKPTGGTTAEERAANPLAARSERFLRGLAAFTPELLARVDAELAAERAAGISPEPPSPLNDGPDPLGIGFAWAGPEKPAGNTPVAESLGDNPLNVATGLASERFARGLALIDDAMCAEVDAQVAADRAAGLPPPPDLRGPDPLGLEWAWARPESVSPVGNTSTGEPGVDKPLIVRTGEVSELHALSDAEPEAGTPQHVRRGLTWRSERLTRGLAAITPEMIAQVDAELAAERAAGISPEPSAPLNDGPDPLGIDFAWAGPDPKK